MSTLLKRSAVSAVAVAVLLLAGCSKSTTQPSATNQPASAAKPAGPPQLVPAKTAFWPMYTSAHNWAPDVITLQVTAKEVPGFKNEAGKAAMWQAAFASPSLREYRIYSYSIAAVPPDIFKGVDAGLALPWGGITRNAMPVDISLFNVDSDAAYKAAAADAADWLKKNPDKSLALFQLGDTFKFSGPVWYLLWGNEKSGYAAFVDADSGKILKHK
ncbi:MAG: hypothetical protein RB191_09550 [Terriglobia bacterium]|nr:hypothetical protein [Terriglobia bacterium]